MRTRPPKPQQAAIDRLRQLAPFCTCTDRQLAQISRLLCEHRAQTGDVLTEEGMRGREFFVIVEGTAIVMVGGKQVATLSKGDFFGEVALLDWGNRSASVVAATELVTLVCGVIDFDAILIAAPPVSRRLSSTLSRRLRMMDRMLNVPTATLDGAR